MSKEIINFKNVTYTDISYTFRGYCERCLKDLAAPNARIAILKYKTWLCFLCADHNDALNGILYPRADSAYQVSLQVYDKK